MSEIESNDEEFNKVPFRGEFMNKLQLIRYILNHDEELLNWYCYNDGTKENPGNKDGFNLPEPDDLTFADTHTYGLGSWGDVCDLLINDGIERGIILETDLG